LLGLGRSIYTVFDRALIGHALERLQQASRRRRGDDSKKLVGSAQFVTATRAGRLLRAHMSPVLGGDGPHGAQVGGLSITGFVLVLEDVTSTNERHARRDALIQSLIEGGRGPLGSIARGEPKCSPTFPTCPQQRDRFLGVIRDEAKCTVARSSRSGSAFSNDLRERWLLEEILGGELLAVAARRIGERAQQRAAGAGRQDRADVDEDLWLRVDSFGLLQALRYLALRLQDEYEVREVRLSLMRSGHLAQLDLSGRHLHEQRNGDELAAGSDEYRRRIVAAQRRRCDRTLQRRDLVSARAGVASGLFPHHAAGGRGAEGSAAGDHCRGRGRASRVL
jgi:DNA polymerase-3 subunit epsilon